MGYSSTQGPWPEFGMVLDSDPTVFPAAHTNEPSWEEKWDEPFILGSRDPC